MSTEAHHGPLDQFIIYPILKLELLGFDISITNSSMTMIIITSLMILLILVLQTNNRGVPGKMHMACENTYLLIEKMSYDNMGESGKKFIPMILSLFLFIASANLFGMIPYSFTTTSHISATIVPSILVFLTLIVAGFKYQGFGFLKLFTPRGVPAWLMPLMIVIELFTFFARPISLSLRLAANMVAGHVFLKVLAGFVVILPHITKLLPVPMILMLTGFEMFVAILQAYIFAVLACVYLRDAVSGH